MRGIAKGGMNDAAEIRINEMYRRNENTRVAAKTKCTGGGYHKKKTILQKYKCLMLKNKNPWFCRNKKAYTAEIRMFETAEIRVHDTAEIIHFDAAEIKINVVEEWLWFLLALHLVAQARTPTGGHLPTNGFQHDFLLTSQEIIFIYKKYENIFLYLSSPSGYQSLTEFCATRQAWK